MSRTVYFPHADQTATFPDSLSDEDFQDAAKNLGKKLDKHPRAILDKVFKEYKGLAKNFSHENTKVVFSDKDRAKRAPGHLEYWPPDEEGSKELPRPKGYDGKHVLEIYDENLQNNPEQLRGAIVGDLLHGMRADPNYESMRQEFTQNYKPNVKKFLDNLKMTRFKNDRPDAVDDMYIRGMLSPAEEQGEFKTEQKERYSPQQMQTLNKMGTYIKTGEVPQEQDTGLKPPI